MVLKARIRILATSLGKGELNEGYGRQHTCRMYIFSVSNPSLDLWDECCIDIELSTVVFGVLCVLCGGVERA